ncbi:hypothetical protein P9D47_06725 [Bacillus haynesii]|uniref:hypothetical protein n=1 Tax=Bacillus haynesii TaxID=1925021 RepID=UPI001593C4CD|nr:hypothetical protein [Bacillus haynesii]NVB35767.1 hypothetical protein [Bacillus licheniformis]MCY7779116.1 hypothetical protein [Bacillus haynesii]MEC0672176.1 hypothetical protein [Bacillus haynesii]MEC1420144.1 hypothetical protein [Bacillus haynesii]MEC1467737.1 hypothetical protein [Bacillus haynesii]
MDVNKELVYFKNEIKKARSFKNVFWKSPFLKSQEDRRKKRGIVFWGIISIVVYILLGKGLLFRNLDYLFEYLAIMLDFPQSSVKILAITLKLCPIIIIIGTALGKFSSLVDPQYQGISDLYYSLSYNAVKKYLHNKNYNHKIIEKRFLPFLISKNSNQELYSIGSFLKVVIPSIVVALPVSMFGIGITTSINDESATMGDLKDYIINLISLTLMLWYIGGVFFKSIPSLNVLSEKRVYKELEQILQGYLLEKDVKFFSRKKIKRKV